MNNATDSANDYACPLTGLLHVLNSYVLPALSVLGVFTNAYCVLVFALIVRYEPPNGHMFKYLLLKAVHDTVQFVVQSFAPLYYCTMCGTAGTYAEQVWFVGFFYYVESINELASGLFDVTATLDCYLNIKQKLGCCRTKLTLYAVVVLATVYPCLFYVFLFFQFAIVRVSSGNETASASSDYYYKYELSDFAYSEADVVFRFIHGIVRDVLILVALLVLNAMLVLTMHNATRKRIELTGGAQVAARKVSNSAMQLGAGHHGERHNSVLVRQAVQAEHNVRVMMLANGLNYLLGHVWSFVAYCALLEPSVFRSCFVQIALGPFYASYVTPFFVYLACNKKFRAYARAVWTSGVRRPVGSDAMVALMAAQATAAPARRPSHMQDFA